MVFIALAFSHQAGLTFNEIVFTPHAVEAPLEPLRMEHFYLCQYIIIYNCILRLKKSILALLILGVGLFLSSLAFLCEKFVKIKYSKHSNNNV